MKMKSIYIYYAFFLFICNNANGQDNQKTILTALSKINALRRSSGLDSVSISKKLSDGCNKHARYLIFNKKNGIMQGLEAHKEHNELKGYSSAGKIAGESAVISFECPTKAIDQFIMSFYHRMPLIQPNLKEIGIGYSLDEELCVTVVDCLSGLDYSDTGYVPIVFYPNIDQKNIPVYLYNEQPNPIDRSLRDSYAAGLPITIFFCKNQAITDVKFTLSEKGAQEVKCVVSTPESPATDFSQWNTVCAIPTSPLNFNTTYIVNFSCKIDGLLYSKIYSFSTMPDE
jgi:hypothetical protein